MTRDAAFQAARGLADCSTGKENGPPQRGGGRSEILGGPTRIRTENQRIMSPLLHR